MTISLSTAEIVVLKQLAAAGNRGRTSRAVIGGLSRLVQASYVTKQSASRDRVVYVITDLGRRALART